MWSKIQRLYLQAKGQPIRTTIEVLEYTSILREDLYRWRPPEGEEILILVQTVRIADDTPEGEVIVVEM